MTTVTIDFDCTYDDGRGEVPPDNVGHNLISAIVQRYAGTIVYFQLSGPGGGNPHYGAIFPSEARAMSFLHDIYQIEAGSKDDDLSHHLRPNGSFDFHKSGTNATETEHLQA